MKTIYTLLSAATLGLLVTAASDQVSGGSGEIQFGMKDTETLGTADNTTLRGQEIQFGHLSIRGGEIQFTALDDQVSAGKEIQFGDALDWVGGEIQFSTVINPRVDLMSDNGTIGGDSSHIILTDGTIGAGPTPPATEIKIGAIEEQDLLVSNGVIRGADEQDLLASSGVIRAGEQDLLVEGGTIGAGVQQDLAFNNSFAADEQDAG